MADFDKYYQASEIKRKILEKQFQAISDVAIIEELRERVIKQRIQLSLYPQHKKI
jgi:trimethylamine:corrinoid methyltransferase-like protein